LVSRDILICLTKRGTFRYHNLRICIQPKAEILHVYLRKDEAGFKKLSDIIVDQANMIENERFREHLEHSLKRINKFAAKYENSDSEYIQKV
jgi:seryl-tRNA(Sec) selenium transferase